MGKISELLEKQNLVLLDSAMGTELQNRGVDISLPLWSANALFKRPDVVKAIHSENILAGADIITTNTFRTHRRTVEKAKFKVDNKSYKDTAYELTKLAVNLARDAVKETRRNVLIAGGIAPLEDCYQPELQPETDILNTEHNEHIRNLLKLGVDILLAETMNSIKEISSVLNQIHGTGYDYLISFVCRNENELYSGENLKDLMKIVEKFNPAAVLTNCIHPELAVKIVMNLKKLTDRPLGVYCNIGNPDLFDSGKFEVCITPQEYYEYAVKWKQLGVKIIGGCCGTSPEFIKKLAELKN